jgi:putative ABC transport system ATP-binding protein
MELFRRLHRDGQSILLVTHDDEVAAAADRIVQMRDGKILDERMPEPVGAGEAAFGVLEDPGR